MINEIVIPIKLIETEPTIKIKLSETGGGGGGERLPYYTGSYKITPRKAEITLPTKNKSMANDVTIFQIPYSTVRNESGGDTVTIGIE